MARTTVKLIVAAVGGVSAWCAAADFSDPRIQELVEQNQRLQKQVQDQQAQIYELRGRLDRLQQTDDERAGAVRALTERVEAAGPDTMSSARSPGEVRISAEAGLAFFSSGRDGQFPKDEFRVDDAKVFFEAPVGKNVYLFAGLDLTTREANDEFFHVGELYVDFENVSALWGRERALNIRAGRFYIPFGEEYQVRGVLANPLVSHSLSDIWGIDEGVEIYGGTDRVQYALAVQNGGHKTLHDFNADKSVAGRIGLELSGQISLSASAMRTGKLNAPGDGLSEVWFGGGFFRALGPTATTRTFWANLIEIDGTARWKGGHLKAAVGRARFDDDDRTTDRSRRLSYYSLEGKQRISGNLFGAVRFSRISVPKGYPLVGQGDFGDYFFARPPTEYLERLSLGLGYQFGPPLIWKAEYSAERGRLINGVRRDEEDLLSTEIGMRF